MRNDDASKRTDPRTNKKAQKNMPRRKINRFWITQWIFNAIVTAALVLSGLHGLWREWWVKYLLIPVGILACSVGVFELCRMFRRTYSTARSLIITGISSFVLGSLVVLAYNLTAPDSIQVWEPPELPKECKVAYVSLFAWDWKINLDKLSENRSYDIIAHQEDATPRFGAQFIPQFQTNTVFIRLKDRRLFVDLPVLFDEGGVHHNLFSSVGTLDNDLPLHWDRNFDNNAFEMVDQYRCPMIQIVYDQPNHISIYGVFGMFSSPNGDGNDIRSVTIDSKFIVAFSFKGKYGMAYPPENIPNDKVYVIFTNDALFMYPASEFQGKRRY